MLRASKLSKDIVGHGAGPVMVRDSGDGSGMGMRVRGACTGDCAGCDLCGWLACDVCGDGSCIRCK